MFAPLAVDSFGGWHEAALELFTKLGQQLRQRLAVVLVRDNMVLLMSRAPAHPPPEIDGDS